MTCAKGHPFVFVAATISLLGLVGPANAAVQCKTSASAGLGLSDTDAIVSWKNGVANHYGAAWSDFNLAQNKFFSETNLGVAVMIQVSARACRQVTLPSLQKIGPKVLSQ